MLRFFLHEVGSPMAPPEEASCWLRLFFWRSIVASAPHGTRKSRFKVPPQRFKVPPQPVEPVEPASTRCSSSLLAAWSAGACPRLPLPSKDVACLATCHAVSKSPGCPNSSAGVAMR